MIWSQLSAGGEENNQNYAISVWIAGYKTIAMKLARTFAPCHSLSFPSFSVSSGSFPFSLTCCLSWYCNPLSHHAQNLVRAIIVLEEQLIGDRKSSSRSSISARKDSSSRSGMWSRIQLSTASKFFLKLTESSPSATQPALAVPRKSYIRIRHLLNILQDLP